MLEEKQYWLKEQERNIIIGALVKEGIIIFDPECKLLLKNGGFTDIYVNLRMMRSKPNVTRFLASAYSDILRKLKIDRFVEVPDSVSILAGAITVKTDIPVVTVREEKSARVTKGKIIGDLKMGETVVIIDDVITDGASKMAVIETLVSLGVKIKAIVVLVDRDQGWREVIPQTDIDVLAGMSLSHIREYLKANPIKQKP